MEAERFARQVATTVDRVFVNAMRAMPRYGAAGLRERYRLPSVGFLTDFRFVLPLRPVAPAGLAAVTRYLPGDPGDEIRAVADVGLVRTDADGAVHATAAGLRLLADLAEVQAATTAGVWAGHVDAFEPLNRMLGPVLAAAPATGGAATAAMLPVHEPPGTPPNLVLLNRLGATRYHRADAYAAAWHEAGLDAAGAAGLGAGRLRDAIEVDTDRRAAPPWWALEAADRARFLELLRPFPG